MKYAVTTVLKTGVITKLYDNLYAIPTDDFKEYLDKMCYVSNRHGSLGKYHKIQTLKDGFISLFSGEIDGGGALIQDKADTISIFIVPVASITPVS